jgi:DNA-binding transcriptional MerR regulator
MATLLTIGEFSRMTHLSVKALRHYHDMGVLEPVAIDPFTGYRSYDAAQVPSAQVIRRLRDLRMPLDSIRTVLRASDVDTRNREIAAHLSRMEQQLEQTRSSVAALRGLLSGPAPHADVELRSIPEALVLAIEETVTTDSMEGWAPGVIEELSAALAGGAFRATGCFGALFPGDSFELERAVVTVFVPVAGSGGIGGRSGDRIGGRVRRTVIPATEAAVAVHHGGGEDIDRTYAALGTVVAERAIGIEGPIREYHVSGLTDDGPPVTEVCWPVFRTGHA